MKDLLAPAQPMIPGPPCAPTMEKPPFTWQGGDAMKPPKPSSSLSPNPGLGLRPAAGPEPVAFAGPLLFNHPFYDDFGFSIKTHAAWRDTGSLGATVAAAWDNTLGTRNTWEAPTPPPSSAPPAGPVGRRPTGSALLCCWGAAAGFGLLPAAELRQDPGPTPLRCHRLLRLGVSDGALCAQPLRGLLLVQRRRGLYFAVEPHAPHRRVLAGL